MQVNSTQVKTLVYTDPTSIPDQNDQGMYGDESDSDDESSITLTSSDSYNSDEGGDEFERFAAYKGWHDYLLLCFQNWYP